MPPLCKGRWHGKAVTEGLTLDASIPQSPLTRSQPPLHKGATAKVPSLCKGRWHGEAVTEGLSLDASIPQSAFG